jgi:hypothetical protein
MNRRTFAARGAAALAMITSSYAQAQTPETAPRQMKGAWEYDDISDPNIGLQLFEVVVTDYPTEGEAADVFSRIPDELDAGAIYDASTHNESYGDESFFAEFQNLGGLILVYMGFVRVGTTLLEARWEADHYGGARDGYRLFEGVIDRAIEGAEGDAVFPSQDELEGFGLV